MTGEHSTAKAMKPLKILTLDGGGLQALSTLSILSKLCDAIAINSGSDRKPAPFELFDIIGGIGTGGWLALLLGRYRLDLTRCMVIYLELGGDPFIKAGRSFFGSKPYTLDQRRLVQKIDRILERYKLSPLLLDDNLSEHEAGVKVRCKHAFAMGQVQSSKQGQAGDPGETEYHIFRSYRTEKTSGPFYHSGPDPATCKVSSVCAATGATKYLLEPFPIGSTTYSDNGFPNPHNITRYALDEAYHIYGEKPALATIVNIGPGIPSQNDVEKLQALARKFSWPYWLPSGSLTKMSSSSSTTTSNKPSPTLSTESSSSAEPDFRLTHSPTRSDTSSSSSSLKAEIKERQFEEDIKERLKRDYRDDSNKIFVRLAPPPARDDMALNDVQAIIASGEEVDKFLAQQTTKDRLNDAARMYCDPATA